MLLGILGQKRLHAIPSSLFIGISLLLSAKGASAVEGKPPPSLSLNQTGTWSLRALSIQWKSAARNPFYKPTKTSTTVRIDSDVLQWPRSQGKGYQTRINAILRREMLASLKC